MVSWNEWFFILDHLLAKDGAAPADALQDSL